MIRLISTLSICFLISGLFSCTTKHKQVNTENTTSLDVEKSLSSAKPKQLDPSAQIGEYIVNIFEDSKGNLWFGTMQFGVAKYDGDKLTYLTTQDGLADNAMVTMVEDDQGNLWMGTHNGLSKFDGNAFTNYTESDGLSHFRVSNLLIDRNGLMWIGTWGGVCTFDGHQFTQVPLPVPEIDLLPYQTTMNWTTELMEDDAGNIWIGRDGYGALKYDGTSFKSLTRKDGLVSNNVQSIVQDDTGQYWFGCRVSEEDNPDPEARTGEGGVCIYDGEKFTYFNDLPGLHHNTVYNVFKNKSGSMWAAALRHGIYRFDGESHEFFTKSDRPDLIKVFGLQGHFEDSKGNFWTGFSGGLFRFEGDSFVNVTVGGPWE